MTDPTMATLLEADGQVGLRYVRRLAHPPEKVWRALTESEHLRHWLPCDIVGERRAGAPIELPFWPEHVESYGIEDPVLARRDPGVGPADGVRVDLGHRPAALGAGARRRRHRADVHHLARRRRPGRRGQRRRRLPRLPRPARRAARHRHGGRPSSRSPVGPLEERYREPLGGTEWSVLAWSWSRQVPFRTIELKRKVGADPIARNWLVRSSSLTSAGHRNPTTVAQTGSSLISMAIHDWLRT